jgi:hypothetical protein
MFNVLVVCNKDFFYLWKKCLEHQTVLFVPSDGCFQSLIEITLIIFFIQVLLNNYVDLCIGYTSPSN